MHSELQVQHVERVAVVVLRGLAEQLENEDLQRLEAARPTRSLTLAQDRGRRRCEHKARQSGDVLACASGLQPS